MSIRTNAIIPKRKWKANSMMPKPKKKREPVITDYLLEKRKKKEEREYNDSYSQNDNKKSRNKSVEWKTLVQKMEHNDKISFLLEKAKQMEEKAKIMNEKSKFIDYNDQLNEKCDDLLIDALKARLAALTDE